MAGAPASHPVGILSCSLQVWIAYHTVHPSCSVNLGNKFPISLGSDLLIIQFCMSFAVLPWDRHSHTQYVLGLNG